MKAPLIVSERILSTLAKAQSEGNAVNRFFLGKSEIDCLIEWASDATLSEFESQGTFMGIQIYPINKPSYFAYELVELAVA